MTTQQPTEVAAFLADLAERAASTFWQTSAATAAILWAGTGLHVHDLLTVDGLHKAVVAVGGGAAAAGFSAVKSMVRGWLARDLPAVVETVADDVEATDG